MNCGAPVEKTCRLSRVIASAYLLPSPRPDTSEDPDCQHVFDVFRTEALVVEHGDVWRWGKCDAGDVFAYRVHHKVSNRRACRQNNLQTSRQDTLRK